MGSDVISFGSSVSGGEVLVIAALHPFPPRCGSAVRIAQYVRHLVRRGLSVDLAVLSDSLPIERDEECARAALSFCSRVVVVRHPLTVSPLARLAYRAWGRMIGFHLGDWLHCPPVLVRTVRETFASRKYRAVIISGVHLSRLASLFRPPVQRILEAQDVWWDRFQSYSALGRGAELGNFSNPKREARLASRFDTVLAINSRDAEIFRKIGVKRPISVVPFVADAELLGLGEDSAAADLSPWEPPARPPRILFVGTESSTNLDAVRFFRARVFPSVRRQVPSCRLRVVGQAARHLEPEPGVDRVGWVDCLAKEYREATAVAVPLRMGSGLKTKVVEALAHGKALLTTPVGAQGVDIVHELDAVVSDDPSILAREAVRILTDDNVRRGYEARAREAAMRFFNPETAFAPLRRLLGLDPRGSAAASGTPEPAFVR